MIEGITILTQEPIMDSGYFWISMLIGVAIAMVIGLYTTIQEDVAAGIATFFYTIILISIASAIVGHFTEKPTDKYIYKVTIDDSVNFTEVYDKYEIIGKNGKIYSIKEIEKD